MIGREKQEEKEITISEAREILEERKDEDTEMLYETKNALEHAQKINKMDADEAIGLVKELNENFSSLDRETAVQIVNLMPETVKDLRVILRDRYRTPDEEAEEEIIDLLK